MKLRYVAGFALALLPLVAGTCLAQAPVGALSPTDRLPLAFVENRGQWDTPADFVVRRGPLTAHFAATEWTLDLRRSGVDTEACAVRLSFEGAREDARPDGERSLPGRYSFFSGADPALWRSDVPSWASILYRAMYPGVDVRVRSAGQDLEYDLLLAPNADLDQVVVRCTGIEGVTIDAGGTLVLATAFGPIRQDPPTTWEITGDGATHPVACRYRRIDETHYGFVVPQRDERRALVIDPGLVWSTYVGGSGFDTACTVIADPSGDCILAGITLSPNFPTSTGAYQTNPNGPNDTFVTRIRADGTSLVWSTFLGGSAGEIAWDLVREESGGDLVVVGATDSNDFPTTVGAYDTTFNGSPTLGDAFVSRLSGDGQCLLYSTYLGGDQDEWARCVALDSTGNVIVAGGTDSNDFPTTPGAFDTTYNGNGDVWVASLRLDGNGIQDLLWSTFLGGSGRDGGQVIRTNINEMKHVSLAIEPNGIATVGGTTQSPNFPVTTGAFGTTYNGVQDLFVARLAAGGGTLQASTFVGGSGHEGKMNLALNRRGEPIVGAFTRSVNFPTTPGAFSATRNAVQDSCLFRLDRTFANLLYSTFIGDTAASTFDTFDAIHVDSAGTVTAVIKADAGFPTTPGAYDRTYSGAPADMVVLRMRTDDQGPRDLHYASYLGGSGGDHGWGLVWDGISIATVVGRTNSVDYPTTPGAYDTSHNGDFDAFVTRIELLPTGVAVFGTSTPGCSGPLAIGVNSMPQVGNAGFALTCNDAPAGRAGFFLLGVARLPASVPVVGIGLWLSPTVVLPATSVGLGYAELALPIPGNQSLQGGQLYGQFVWPSACGARGLSASNAVDFVIQP